MDKKDMIEKEQDKKFDHVLASYKKFYKVWMPIFFVFVIITNVMNLFILLLSKYVKQMPLAARITLLSVQGLFVVVLLVATIMMVVRVIQFRKSLKQFELQNKE